MKRTIEPRLLREAEAAEFLGMSTRYLRKARYTPSEGTPGPPFVKLGKSIRYDREDLVEWIQAHKMNRPVDYGRG